MALEYGDGSDSSVGSQLRTDFYQKKALIEAKKEQYFSQLADVTAMPKNMGKTIKRYHYLPMLDVRNVNDQGIDAAGVQLLFTRTIGVTSSIGLEDVLLSASANTAAAAQTAVEAVFIAWADAIGITVGNYATTVTNVEANANFASVTLNAATANAETMYGSSKDIGTVNGKMPLLSESGGTKNRVGFTRVEIEGSIVKYGFYDEYTQESMDFDTDAELEMHITREAVMGANEITEDLLQIDLLNGASTIRWGGVATSDITMSGDDNTEGLGTPSVASYEDLMRLSIDLDELRCPKHTKVITGTRMIDTKTIDAARIMYIGSELIPTVKRMVDLHGNPAFVAVQHYAAAGNTVTGEIGSVDQFRIVVVPEMMHWAGGTVGGGAIVGALGGTTPTNQGYRETNGAYDVYPMLVVGSGSFTTIGFQTDGKTVKFKITHKKPGAETADSYNDPFGEIGFYSIKWYYGSMILRSERLAIMKSIAEL